MDPTRLFINRRPGQTLALLEVVGLAGGGVLLILCIAAKNLPANSELVLQVVRNYGTDTIMMVPFTCMILLVAQAAGEQYRWSRPLLWNRTLIWLIPTFVLAVGYFCEWAQYRERPSHGDWRDLLAEALDWAITVVPLVWADHADRQTT